MHHLQVGIVMSKLVYLVTLWEGAQQYLLKSLLVQQLTAARVVCGFECWGWSKARLLDKVGWMSVRQLIVYHSVLQRTGSANTVKKKLKVWVKKNVTIDWC